MLFEVRVEAKWLQLENKLVLYPDKCFPTARISNHSHGILMLITIYEKHD